MSILLNHLKQLRVGLLYVCLHLIPGKLFKNLPVKNIQILLITYVRHFFSGFMHAHISYLAEDCQACLVLLTIDHDLFFILSDAKKKITEVCYVHIIFNIYLLNL